ncbi:N-alpha-acetyltransferase 35, NatC auxiliary subunit-like [Daphnia carinata]|uniref:N-alpha-acetyltransferase 35, NatC auxiliary subunit-like n=1 Tax=Daphnia carinata TaxID=120202 RepID=UPI00257D855E|nr:N-alpha-acetyltransferase 35, NatC auxiliary subunit-like [Daphnia carinata]
MARPPEVVYSWRDITSDFKASVKDLELGELAHDDLFGLFEAMSAIEMMDPKMDAGMHQITNGSKKILNFDQAVKAGKLELKKVNNDQFIGIVDNSIACLVTWLEGHSLAQTVFINLYAQHPQKIEDRNVKAFITLFLKVVDLIKDYINQASVFEEEDFQPLVYGFRLASEIPELKALALIKESEEDLMKEIKNSVSSASAEGSHELKEISAVHTRLRFFRHFYQLLLKFNRRESSATTVNAHSLIEEILKSTHVCREALNSCLQTISLGSGYGAEEIEIMGFEPQVNQRLLPPTFPRYTQLRSRAEAINNLIQLMDRLKAMCKIKEHTNFHAALDFFYNIGRQRPPPCVLSRSLLQLLYIPLCNRVFGQQPLTEVLQEAARSFIAPPALTGGLGLVTGTPQHAQVQECVDQLFQQCVRPMGSLIQIAGHNLARQRDKFGHILQDLATLQEEADKVDAYLHTISLQTDSGRSHLACLGTWVLLHTLRTMIQYLFSGFELSLYSIYEYHYIFWYLYEFLYGWLISAYNRADSFLTEHQSMAEYLKSKGKGPGATNKKGGQSGNGKSKKKKERAANARPYAKEIAYCQAVQSMCGGYYKAMVAMDLEGKIRRPRTEFDDERVRYEHRFAPLGQVSTPPLVPYVQFKEMTKLEFNATDENDKASHASNLYATACRHFHHAATILTALTGQSNDENVLSLIRVCKTNCVVMRLLAGGHRREGASAPQFDFTVHPHLPIVKVT